MPTLTSRYSPDWPKIAFAIKEREGWHCYRCGIQGLRPGQKLFSQKDRAYLLQVHHWDCDPSNNSPENLAALCTVHHLQLHHWRGTITPGQLSLPLDMKSRLPLRAARRVPVVMQLNLWERGSRWRQLGFWD